MIECSICKANNEDKSLFCLECGQRLIPKVPDAHITANILPATNFQQINTSNSARLHSPILDLGGQAENKKSKPLNKPVGFAEATQREANTGRANGISRNGLHSPLLDGQNHFANPYPDQDEAESANVQSNPPQNHVDKSRLHSPVLDGPISASYSVAYEESFSEDEEYESLRSPLLQAKVPLPEKNEALENPTGQESRLQSLLGSATGPSVKAVPNNPFNVNVTQNNVAQNNFAQKESFVAPLSITGINKLSQANQASISRIKSERISGSNSLLPTEEEISSASKIEYIQGQFPLNKMLLISLIFLALGFKVWYLISLGSAAFGSAPFAFDQAGQIIVLLLMLVLVLS